MYRKRARDVLIWVLGSIRPLIIEALIGFTLVSFWDIYFSALAGSGNGLERRRGRL